MQNLQTLLKLLTQSPLEFILVGGFAAVLHGCNQTTRDIDICIVHSPEQIQLLQKILKSHHPRYRMTDKEISFLDSPPNFSKKQDLHFITDLGVVDIVAHIEGIGDYYDVLKNSEEIEIYESKCRLISLEDLILSKKKLGRHRDLVTVMELEAIRNGKE